PFDSFVHMGDIRNIAVGRGGYNIPSIGIFVWRLSAYSLTDVPAKRAFKPDPYRYFFNPLGYNTQLFSRPQREENITQLAGPRAVALPINPSMLKYFLSDYYGQGKSLLLSVDGKDVLPDPKQPEQKLADLITISNLK